MYLQHVSRDTIPIEEYPYRDWANTFPFIMASEPVSDCGGSADDSSLCGLEKAIGAFLVKSMESLAFLCSICSWLNKSGQEIPGG